MKGWIMTIGGVALGMLDCVAMAKDMSLFLVEV